MHLSCSQQNSSKQPKKVAGAAGLEPVTSAVTGQRSNQLSYAPAWSTKSYETPPCSSSRSDEEFGQQTPRRWGWGTPLKKRTATRIVQIYGFREACQQLWDSSGTILDSFNAS